MKYRKKPVIIEAYRLGYDDVTPDWFMDALTSNTIITHDDSDRSPFDCSINTNITATIKTLEGYHLASNGDYIIQGVKGELYACKPDIFHATYEEVSK